MLSKPDIFHLFLLPLFRAKVRLFAFRWSDFQMALIAVTTARIAPLHFANHALVTSVIRIAAEAARFRLRLGGGVALRLRSRRLSVSAPLFPLADRRPKQEQTM